MIQQIDANTSVGAVHLTVSNLEQSLAFYQENIGLTLQGRTEETAYLGVASSFLLQLSEKPGAQLANRVTGLYHFALLLPSRLELARTLQHLIETKTGLSGFADHAVSEAIYLSDPDGHGIEIYRDRPRQEWVYNNGQLQLTTLPFDMHGALAELSGNEPEWNGLHPETRMGHMHLHVSDLTAAERFYTQLMGFELVTRYGPSAAFVAAGGYHHHIGLNTWAGVGAPPPPAEALGMQWFELVLPHEAAHDQLMQRLQSAGAAVTEDEEGMFVTDPSGNKILLIVS